MILHPVINALDERKDQIDRSVRKGVINLPTAIDRYAWLTQKEGTPLVEVAHLDAAVGTEANDDDYSVPFVISVYNEDRDGDVVVPMGCQLGNYSNNPLVFFGHQQNPYPIGKSKSPDGRITVFPSENNIRATAYFDRHDPNADFIYGKVKRGYLNAASIAFVPIEAYRRDHERKDFVETDKARLHHPPLMPPGWIFKIYDLTEWSIVGVPSNAGAIRDSLDREGKFLSPRLQKGLAVYAAKAKQCWNGWCEGPNCNDSGLGDSMSENAEGVGADTYATTRQGSEGVEGSQNHYVPKQRWNKSLSSVFDGDELRMDSPSGVGASTVYRIASKYLQCEIKDLYQNSTSVPSPRMGSFLTGLKHVLAPYRLVEIRNIRDGYGDKDKESPPVHEAIQLNSKQRDSFLVQGTAFYEGIAPTKRGQPRLIAKEEKGRGPHNSMGRGTGEKFIVKYEPNWSGIAVTVFTKNCDARLNQSIIDQAWIWARENNFLKGEAFALSGEFLTRTDEGWEDVFLEEHNKKAVKRTLELFNTKQLGFANRGIVLTGPPGTGKTLSGRIIRNQAKGTFIWVSSRDFHSAGSVGGLGMAFEMAKELAPSIIFMEDVDNWLHPTTIDLLKTEMDGISRSKGVLTILTTNFPEQLPDALIDRPGRFHDVLQFDLPTSSARLAMLAKWLPNVSETSRSGAVSKTAGYSGAHVYELARFAETLQEYDGMDPEKALETAIEKVEQQRELITKLQLEGSNYNPLREGRSSRGNYPRNTLKEETPSKVVTKSTKATKDSKEHKCDCDDCITGRPCGCEDKRETKSSKKVVNKSVSQLVSLLIKLGQKTGDNVQGSITADYLEENYPNATTFEKIMEIIRTSQDDEGYAEEGATVAAKLVRRRKFRGKNVRSIKVVQKYIKHEGSQWIVYSESGKVLGKHKTKEDAERQLRAVEANKHKSSKVGKKEIKGLSSTSGTEGGYTIPDTNSTDTEGIMVCESCDGTGSCPDCGGDGVTGEGEDCESCEGSGNCPECEGTGQVEKTPLDKEQEKMAKNQKRKAKKDEDYEEDDRETEEEDTPTEGDEDEVEDDDVGNDNDEDEEEEVAPKPSAQALAALYSHAKSEHNYIDEQLKTMDHPGVSQALQKYKDEHVVPRMDHLKSVMEEHHPDHDMDELVKAFEGDGTPGGGESTPGEEGAVASGNVPPDSVEDDVDGVDRGGDETDEV
jgi:hypothetical protein